MAIRNIVKQGDPVLEKTARTVLNFDERLARTSRYSIFKTIQ